MRRRGPLSVTEPRPLPRPVARVRLSGGVFFRAFVLGAVAVVASAWALWHHLTVPLAPMLVPAPAATEVEIEP